MWLDMTPDERTLYEVHRCVENGSVSTRSTEQLNACSHLYNPEIVCGAHKAFERAHGEALRKREPKQLAVLKAAASYDKDRDPDVFYTELYLSQARRVAV